MQIATFCTKHNPTVLLQLAFVLICWLALTSDAECQILRVLYYDDFLCPPFCDVGGPRFWVPFVGDEVIPGTEEILDDGQRLDLSGWNTESRNLRYAFFGGDYRWLEGADFSNSWLDHASFGNSALTDADFTDATVVGSQFQGVVFGGGDGFTAEQLYSTLSYKTNDLRGIDLRSNDLRGWNFQDQDLTNARFYGSNLAEVDFTDAVVRGTQFESWQVERDFHPLSADQLYSTRSYRERDLRGIGLSGDLRGWDLSNQDLTDASLASADLTGADLTGANVQGVDFWNVLGLTSEQFYSTQSYQDKDLRGVDLARNDLGGWDLTNQDLTHVNFRSANLTNADLTAANLKNSELWGTANLAQSIMGPTTVYNQWTSFPIGFDPVSAGLTYEPSPIGDYDANDAVDLRDLVRLERAALGQGEYWVGFDFQPSRGGIDVQDLRYWLFTIKDVIPGDADVDGRVDFADFLTLSNNFGERGYWSAGDFDLSGDVQFADFLLLAANFGTGSNVASVPEPISLSLTLSSLLGLITLRRRRSNSPARHVKSANLSGNQRRSNDSSFEGLENRHLLSAISLVTHLVDVETSSSFVHAADMDSDGDLDVFTASASRRTMSWYENMDGRGTFSEPQTIDFEADKLGQVFRVDLNNDGDLDIATVHSGRISWLENLGDTGAFAPAIDLGVSGDRWEFADVDADGEIDLLSIVYAEMTDEEMESIDYEFGDKTMISWYENTGDPRALSFAHEVPIVTKVPQHGVDVVDVDGDGDKDILATQTESGGVTGWHENLSGGIFADVQVITDEFLYGGSRFLPVDLDGDADLDLLLVLRPETFTPTSPVDRLAWYENAGDGSFGESRLIDRYDFHPVFDQVFTVDFDRDGDTDIIGLEFRTGMVWHENEGGGRFEPRVLLLPDAYPSAFADIDGDGDPDALSTPRNAAFAWHENRLAGDADSDGKVAFSDFLILSTNFGKEFDAVWAEGDFNEDGKVEFADFLILAENFGKTSHGR